MRILTSIVFLFVLVAALALGRAATSAAGCGPDGHVRFVCDQISPEDLIAVPGGTWVLASGMAAGGAIRLISIRDKTSTVLFPSASSKARPDTKTYGSCPGPIDLSDRDKFRAHGLYLRAGRGSTYTLYLVHHGSRESIEIFELDMRATPALTWIGCAVAPDTLWLNSVVGLPDGGFVTTNFARNGANDPNLGARIREGKLQGELWEWHPQSGWQMVPGSEIAGPNGLEISPDGRWLYIGAWGPQSVVRLSRGQTPVTTASVPVGFHVDNIRWAPDGSLLAAGQGGTAPAQASHVARVNTKTMTAQELVRHPYTETFTMGTVAIQLGSELWVGSYRGDRIAIFPASPSR